MTTAFVRKNINVGNNQTVSCLETDKKQQPVFLFIHGLEGNAGWWKSTMSQFADKGHCIALDLPGHGFSSGLDDYSLKNYAKTIAEFIKQNSLENITVIAHSMGAQISILLATEYPNLIRNLILIAPAGFEELSNEEVKFLKNVFHSQIKLTKPFISLLSEDLLSKFGADKESTSFELTKTNMMAMLDEQISDLLQKIHCPTLVLFGEEDPFIPIPVLNHGTIKLIAEKACNQIPNSTLIILPQVGHFLHVEDPDVFKSAVTAFMKKDTNP